MTARVAIVKSAGRADAFADAVRDVGLVPVLVSPFQVEELPGVHQAMCETLCGAVAWFAVTSPHACVDVLGMFSMSPFKVAAVGPGTASALRSIGYEVTLVGTGGAAELGRKIVEAGLRPREVVLHPCAEDARPELREIVEAAGGRYVAVPTYRMVADPVGERAAEGEFAAVVVGSPNLARRAVELFPQWPACVAIGRTTASALRDLGRAPDSVAATATPADVSAALRRALKRGT